MYKILLFVVSLFVSVNGYAAEAAIPLREVNVKIAVSSEFKTNPEWEREIRERIVYANQIFEPSFNIHFYVKEFVAWDLTDERRETDLLMEELRSFIPIAENEIVIGFHRMSKDYSENVVIDHDIVGSAQFFRGYVVIRDPFQEMETLQRNVILTHELGHLFGAIHTENETDIMAPRVSLDPPKQFDFENNEIIQSTRDVNFLTALDGLSEEAVRGLVRIYEKRRQANPRGDFYHQLGLFYRRLNEPAKAITVWEEAMRFQYENPYIHHELGFYYFQTGRFEDAIREIGSAVSHFVLPSQKKQLANALNFLGAAYFQKGNVDQSIMTWLKGLASDPDSSELQGNLAVAYLESGNVEKGIAELEKMVAKNPNNPSLLSNLGLARARTKKYQEAIELFLKALDLKKREGKTEGSVAQGPILFGDITEADIHANLGGAYLSMRQYEDALREFEIAKSAKTKDIDFIRNLAQAYAGLKMFDLAIKETKEALRYKSDDAYLYAILAQAYAETGHGDQAIEEARKGLRFANEELAAALYRNIAIMYAQDKRFDDAIREIKMALTQNWKDPEMHFFLGELYMQVQKKEDAVRAYKGALQMNPSYEQAKERLKQLE